MLQKSALQNWVSFFKVSITDTIRKGKNHRKWVHIYAKAQNHARFPHLILETLRIEAMWWENFFQSYAECSSSDYSTYLFKNIES